MPRAGKHDGNGGPTVVDPDTLAAITNLIAGRFTVERVILFGSHARGVADDNSDVDLLVVVAPGERPSGPGNPIRRAIAERFVLPMDVLVCDTEQVAAVRDDPSSVIHHALTEGRVLYDRAA